MSETPVVTADISEFQVPVNDEYTREWLIFRACDGGYIDKHAAHNLAWSVAARAAGKLRNFTAYVVYRPGGNAAILRNLSQLGVPHDCVVMIDAETWGSQIVGDHSAELNALAQTLRTRQGGRSDLVWAYGNRGPDVTVWPHKASWIEWEVASYGGSNPAVPNEVGWQYTDGTYSEPGLPNSSAPFGHCDHNVLYKLPEEDVALDPKDPVVVQILNLLRTINTREVWELNGDAEHPSAGLRDLSAKLDKVLAAVSK